MLQHRRTNTARSSASGTNRSTHLQLVMEPSAPDELATSECISKPPPLSASLSSIHVSHDRRGHHAPGALQLIPGLVILLTAARSVLSSSGGRHYYDHLYAVTAPLAPTAHPDKEETKTAQPPPTYYAHAIPVRD